MYPGSELTSRINVTAHYFMLPYRHTCVRCYYREKVIFSSVCVLAMYTLTKLFLHSSDQLDVRLITSVTPAETQLIFITNVRCLTVASE